MEIICVDGAFAPEVIAFFKEHGVVVPTQDSMYTIREVVTVLEKGTKGLLLEELPNPKVPQYHSVLGSIMYEPNWAIERFRTLSGDIINAREVEKELAQKLVK